MTVTTRKNRDLLYCKRRGGISCLVDLRENTVPPFIRWGDSVWLNDCNFSCQLFSIHWSVLDGFGVKVPEVGIFITCIVESFFRHSYHLTESLYSSTRLVCCLLWRTEPNSFINLDHIPKYLNIRGYSSCPV